MRSFIRIDEELIVQYSSLTSWKSRNRISTDTTSKNISVVGICFRSHCKMPINKHLVIELQLPFYKSPMTPIGRVAWCRSNEEGYDIGAELMWFDWQSDEQLMFARYINEKLKPSSQQD